jgi:hypothetical protein
MAAVKTVIMTCDGHIEGRVCWELLDTTARTLKAGRGIAWDLGWKRLPGAPGKDICPKEDHDEETGWRTP